MEIWTIFLLFFLCLTMGIGGWLFFIWAVKTDQFENLEETKYKIIEEENRSGKGQESVNKHSETKKK